MTEGAKIIPLPKAVRAELGAGFGVWVPLVVAKLRERIAETRGRRRRDRWCLLWPTCDCASIWQNWPKLLREEGEPLTPAEIADATAVMYGAYCCMSLRCPIRALRQHAARQVTHRIWDEARSTFR